MQILRVPPGAGIAILLLMALPSLWLRLWITPYPATLEWQMVSLSLCHLSVSLHFLSVLLSLFQFPMAFLSHSLRMWPFLPYSNVCYSQSYTEETSNPLSSCVPLG